MKLYLFSLVLFFSNISFGQNIYYLSQSNVIFKINEDNSISLAVNISPGITFYDIALSPNDQFYALAQQSIYKVYYNSNRLLLTTLPLGNYKSLVCSDNNELYTINNTTRTLYKYNITNSQLEMLALIGLDTPGDITFYKGNLIFPTIDGISKKIMSYNLQTNSLSTIFCFDNNFGSELHGITNVHGSCDSETIYISTSDYIYQLDFSQNLAINTGVFVGVAGGLTSSSEFLSSNCNFTFQNINCNLGIDDLIKQNLSPILFSNPVDDILKIQTEVTIERIEIYSIEGKLIKQIDNPEVQINLTDFDSGIYLLYFYTKDKVIKGKVIKK